ncbi:hypothetical protein [Gemmatimonas sp.]|uniref:hypothetical protein n=1 Tax=Gemmatimonas sp. TaxID=1962908 RepID=UPI0039832C1D
MTRILRLPPLLLAFAAFSLRASDLLSRRTVTSVEYLGTFSASQTVPVFRTQSADVVVRGSFLDLSTGVEVRTPSGATVSGTSATIVSKTGGANTRITVRLTTTNATPLGALQLRIRYLVETNGPDVVNLRLFDHGTISAMRIEEPAIQGRFTVGQAYTLVVSGSELNNTAYDADERHVTLLSTVSRSATEARFRIRVDSAGRTEFLTRAFFDGNLSGGMSGQNQTTAHYELAPGAVEFVVIAGLDPKVTAVSPDNDAPIDQEVTLAGTHVAPRGYLIRAQFGKRYFSNSQRTIEVRAEVVNGIVRLRVPPDITQAPANLFYAPINGAPADSLIVRPRELPPINAVSQLPQLVSSRVEQIATLKVRALFAGSQVLVGKHLASVGPLSSVKLTSVSTLNVTSIAPTVRIGNTLSVRFGNTSIPVTSAAYFPTAQMSADLFSGFAPIIQGADSIKLNVPVLPDTVTGTLTLTNAAGSTSIPDVFYAPPPVVTDVQVSTGNGQFQPVANTTLVRGERYRVFGRALRLVRIGSPLSIASWRMPGVLVTFNPGVEGFEFVLPQTATSGPVTIQTIAGSTSLGSFTVIDRAAAFTIVGVQVSPNQTVGGNTVTATIAVNAEIPVGGSAGNIVFSAATVNDTTLVVSSAPIAVTTNPVVLTIATKNVSAVRTASITVSTLGTASISTARAGLMIQPPAPTAIGLGSAGASSATVVGGRTISGFISLNTRVTGSAIPIALGNSDPTSATVPSVVNVGATVTPFTITTPIVPTRRVVTITATADGQTRSATLTVDPPTIASLVLQRTTAIAETVDSATITMTAVPVAPLAVSITCADPALVCPAVVTVSSLITKFAVGSVAIPAPRTGTIEATANGESRSASLTLSPLVLASAVVSPVSVTAGASTSLTIRLNSAVPTGEAMSVRVQSDGSSVVAPTSVPFRAGDLIQLVTLSTQALTPQSAAVLVTVSFTRQTTFGPYTSTLTVPVTVTP